jgi:two-component system sensor histidine kinase QseC
VNFSPEKAQINVTLTFDDDRFELSVADQGPGISESDRERLFERFYSSGNDQGVGLGLTIVQTVARRLGGEIILKNMLPKGLVATLAVPASAR